MCSSRKARGEDPCDKTSGYEKKGKKLKKLRRDAPTKKLDVIATYVVNASGLADTNL